MTIIHQPGLGTTQQLTYSTWFRISDPADLNTPLSFSSFGHSGIDLINFGIESDPLGVDGPFGPIPDNYYDHSSISIIPPDGSPRPYRVAVRLVGDFIDTSFPSDFGSATHDYETGIANGAPAGTMAKTHMSIGHCAFIPNTITFTNKWHHLFVAVDLAHTDTWMGVDTGSTLTRNRRIEVYFDRARITGDYLLVASNSGFPTAPAAQISPGGFDLSVPVMSSHATDAGDSNFPMNFPLPTPAIKFAFTQIWFDQFIDASIATNLDKFAPSNGFVIKPPADVAAAQTAFGRSDIWLYRKKSSGIRFQDNHGTSGAFTLEGAGPADFSPGP